MSTLAAYLLAALVAWCAAIPGKARPSEETLRPWAVATAAACGPDVKRCTFLAALAFEESGFREHVLNFDCNDPAWRAAHEPLLCDGGEAWGPWQIHDGPWLKAGMSPKRASPEEQARIAASLREGAWASLTRRLAHGLAESWVRQRRLE
jgi:hypothetical protein